MSIITLTLTQIHPKGSRVDKVVHSASSPLAVLFLEDDESYKLFTCDTYCSHA